MRPLRVLIIEDDEEWRNLIKTALEELEPEVDEVKSQQEAESRTRERFYDLITVDLSLAGDARNPDDAGAEGLALLEQIRQGRCNREAAVLVLTGHPSFDRFDRILRFHQAHRLLTKDRFTRQGLRSAVREALREARLANVDGRPAGGSDRMLTVRFLEDCWVGCQLTGPQKADYFARRPLPWTAKAYMRRGDDLHQSLIAELQMGSTGQLWRPSARSLGEDLLREVRRDGMLHEYLTTATAASPDDEPLVIRFAGPIEGLRVPFELVHEGPDYLCLDQIVVRQLIGEDIPWNHRERSLSRFVRTLIDRDEVFQILLVGAEADASDEPLESVEEEIRQVEEVARLELERRLGLRLRIEKLTGKEATPDRVKALFRKGIHLFHYAGHGTFMAENPELSGLVLWQDGKPRVLTTGELRGLAAGSQVRLAFLNCCLAARTASSRGRGDFHGVLEAVVKAGVPWVLGHRWPVLDSSAAAFARDFYNSLWRTFNPGRAALDARRLGAGQEPLKRDNPIWASSILVSQNS